MNELSTSRVNEFKKLFEYGISKIVEACKIYVEEIDKGNKKQFQELCPDVHPSAWSKFENIGRGVMHPKLLCLDSVIERPLSKMPISVQTEAIESGVDVLVEGGNVLHVQVKNLTPLQSKQVFAKNYIRDTASQRAWIESKKTEDVIPVENIQSYEVKKNKVTIFKPTIFTRHDIVRILSEME